MRAFVSPFTSAVLFLAIATSAAAQNTQTNTSVWSDQKDALGDPLPIGAIARIGTTRYRPASLGSRGLMPELSPDGRMLAIIDSLGAIDIVELPAWKRLRSISGISAQKDGPMRFSCAAFSSDSKKLVGFDRGKLRLFDLATGKAINQITVAKKNELTDVSVTMTRDQNRVVLGGQLRQAGPDLSYQFFVWDLVRREITKSFLVPAQQGAQGRRSWFAVSPTGTQVAVNLQKLQRNRHEFVLELWDVQKDRLLHTLPGERGMQRLAYSPDGKCLVACSNQSMVRIFQSETGKEVHSFRHRRGSIEAAPAFAPDGKSFYLVEDDYTQISQWDLVTAERMNTHPTPSPKSLVRQIAFTAQGTAMALGSFADALTFWEVATGKLLSPVGEPSGQVREVRFSNAGELFMASADLQPGWWNPRTGAKVRGLKFDAMGLEHPFIAHKDIPLPFADSISISRMLLLASGEYLCVQSDLGLSVIDTRTGRWLYDDETDFDMPVCFLGTASRMASARNNTIRVWDSRTGRDEFKITFPLSKQENPSHLLFSPDESFCALATAGDQGRGRAILWDVKKNKVVREWPWNEESPVVSLGFSPDSRWLAIAGEQGRLQLSRIAGGALDEHLSLAEEAFDLTSIAFSPDSRELTCAATVPSELPDVGKIFHFELASKKKRLEQVGHPTGTIERLAYSRDGTLLASGSTDTTALVWRAGLRGFLEKRADKDFPATDLEKWYKQIAGADAMAAFKAMIKLGEAPAQAVKLLAKKIPAAMKPDTQGRTVEAWIRDLRSTQFVLRARASDVLQKIGMIAEPELRAALAKAEDVEGKRRLEELLDRLVRRNLTPEEILHVRAVELLEAVGTDETRTLLSRWSSGEPSAVLTEQARIALHRLGK